MKKAFKIGGAVVVTIIVVIVGIGVVLAGRYEESFTFLDTTYPKVTVSADPEVLARGEYLVRTVGHCTQCHGDYPRTEPAKNTPDVPLSGGFEFAMGPLGTMWSSNLTSDPETGLGRRSDEEIARAIATGVLPDGKLSLFMRFASDFSAEDLSAVVSYLRSLPPVKKAIAPPEVSFLGKAMLSLVDFTPDTSALPEGVPSAEEPSAERGRYLAEKVALCVFCHTQVDPMTAAVVGEKAAGSAPDPSPEEGSDMEFVAPNLTPDPKTGFTGRVDEDGFVARLNAGRMHVASKMPWENLSRMSESDKRSIYRYLRTLPPIERDVGPTLRASGWKPGS